MKEWNYELHVKGWRAVLVIWAAYFAASFGVGMLLVTIFKVVF